MTPSNTGRRDFLVLAALSGAALAGLAGSAAASG
jgi:hypothetical protein